MADPSDPAYRNWYMWRQERLFALWDHWDALIRGINPAARFIANSGGGALSTLSMKSIGQRADILFADRQARHGTMSIWSNGKNGKEYRATLGHKPIGGIFSVGVEEQYRWKDSVQKRAGDQAVDCRWAGQWAAPLVHQIWRRTLRQPLAPTGGRGVQLAGPA
ncbi:MAG: hypothetical protein R2911_18020 [Caldilineaceae bacterium]